MNNGGKFSWFNHEEGAPAWFYASLYSMFYWPLAYFIYNVHDFGPYVVIGYLIFSSLYRAGADARQNRKFALALSTLTTEHAQLKRQYDIQISELREELYDVKESIESMGMRGDV